MSDAREDHPAGDGAGKSGPGALGRLLPWLVALLLAAGFLGRNLRPPRFEKIDLEAFSRLPTSHQGRIKPLDSVARTSLLLMSGKSALEHEGRTIPAIVWLADVIARPDRAADYATFRIDDPDVKTLVGATSPEQKMFTARQLGPRWQQVAEQARMAARVDGKQRSAYQQHVLELYERIVLLGELSSLDSLYLAHPLEPDQEWQNLRQAGRDHPASRTYEAVFSAYAEDDGAAFGELVGAYRDYLGKAVPGAVRTAALEVQFNRAEVFTSCAALYVVIFVLAALSWLFWRGPLGRTALALLAITMVLHTLGLCARVYIMGRPPVTNLYSSAVFIGWGAVLLAFFIETIYRKGIGTVTAAVIGFTTLIIAHYLSLGGDTMAMLQAVLDTNFWLATHVVVITLGYSATFLAGFLAVGHIGGEAVMLLRGGLPRPASKILTQMVYGVVCFALLFSFVGTILGGIWADQSWGRFWGWDPKENGALLIVLWNALILHARWGNLVRTHGLMILAVGGNIVTAWSWFGTNLLGVGLHSYGFMDGAMTTLVLFVASQVVLMGVGLLPALRDKLHQAPPAAPG